MPVSVKIGKIISINGPIVKSRLYGAYIGPQKYSAILMQIVITLAVSWQYQCNKKGPGRCVALKRALNKFLELCKST